MPGFVPRALATHVRTGWLEAAQRSVRSTQSDDRFERKDTKSGKFMFNLRARNGQVIGTSETYESAKARDNGIASVAKNAGDAKVEDQTA